MQIKLDLFAANKLLSEEIKDDTDKVNSMRSSSILAKPIIYFTQIIRLQTIIQG